MILGSRNLMHRTTFFPEVTIDIGWRDIAIKIDRSTNEDTGSLITNIPRNTDPKTLYVVRESKWQTKDSTQELTKLLWLTESQMVRLICWVDARWAFSTQWMESQPYQMFEDGL